MLSNRFVYHAIMNGTLKLVQFRTEITELRATPAKRNEQKLRDTDKSRELLVNILKRRIRWIFQDFYRLAVFGFQGLT